MDADIEAVIQTVKIQDRIAIIRITVTVIVVVISGNSGVSMVAMPIIRVTWSA